ncbi:MAG: hypothetical protein ACE5J7_02535 [Candidatus Aenigmatarchaeota archaeon]
MSRERSIGFWVLGSVCILFGAMFAGASAAGWTESSTTSIAIGTFLAFFLILIGGMFWITVAISHFE